MPAQPHDDHEQLVGQLAHLAQHPDAPVDATVRVLHAELETLAESLKQPLPPDPFEEESACRRAVAAVQALATEMTASGASSTDAPATPIPERLEHFRILKLLGQGGMGAVYLAEDTRLGRKVALKTMRPDLAAKPGAKERFLREARLAAALEHDHICSIYHVGEADGTPYLAMPFLKGQSLEDLIGRNPKLAPAQVIRLGIQIAAGLAAAHDKGLIHRDIKPGNLWIDPTAGGRVKILDFGLARSSETDTGLTQSGTILGTPAYMAPEQAKGDKVDARADLYSLGVVLYRLATGELPLKGKDTMSMLMALGTETPRPAHEVNSEVPAELSALIMRLLAKDRDARPASARQVMQELQGLQQAGATVSLTLRVPVAAASPPANSDAPESDTIVQPEPLPGGRGAGSRRRWPLVVVGLLFAFLGGGLLLQQIFLRITDKEGKTRDIELKPGDRVEIVEKHTPKSDPATTPPKKDPDIKIIGGDPDRRAAEYVLSIGGQVQLNDKNEWINAPTLPKEPFRLTAVNLQSNEKVTDAGLAHFKDCKGLLQLRLEYTKVTDAGLAHFQDCKGLTHLILYNTRVTDAGLAHFKDCKGLTALQLGGTQVTDAGLAHFQDCKGLMHVYLGWTQVTDAGLAHFQDCKGLTHLTLEDTRVTDESLPWISGQLRLSTLSIPSTRISLLGYEQLKTAMPRCNIDWSEPNRSVAERVLALGGTVEIGFKGQPAWPVKAVEDLTKELFQVRRVSLAGVNKPLDNLPDLLSLLRFDDFDRLEKLDLSGITGLNYGFLTPIAGLEELSLANAGLNDVSLGQLPKLPALKRLVLDGNEIRGRGLAALSEQPALVELSLNCPTLTDLLAKNLAELKQLKRLSLAGSSLGDAGIQHLEGLTNLEALDLRQTKVTAAGIERLQKALPQCKIDW
uniref:non-specific serine/threonine protein kinase n=1 Tax=Schlesneria paludicola TaxID=360056 RepID=A0A7C4LLH5_9PLAN